MSQSISRRTVLRGLGTAVALPYLEAMMPLTAMAQSAAPPPIRMGFVFVPNGVRIEHWTPTAVGTNFELPSILKPLQDVRGSLNVLTGLAQQNAAALGDGAGDHARSTACWLTGVHPKKTAGSDIHNGISVDQVAAQRIGQHTRLASIELGCERGAVAGDCDSGYSCAYSSSISWRGESTPNAKEINPRLVFERLFGSEDSTESAEARARRERNRKSVLDFVMEDASGLKKQLGRKDQTKLDEYLEGVRDLEKRVLKLEAQEGGVFASRGSKPQGIPQDYREHLRLMGDMMVLAFQADVTRIATFMFANEGSNRSFPQLNISRGHHEISHHGGEAEKLNQKEAIDHFYMEQFAYILGRMREIKEGDGTLLDHSMIVYGGGISDGNRHNHDDLPILFAGRGGGSIKTGRHIRYESGTPMTNLFLSMLDRSGVNVDKLGDSTGKLQGLF
ncbi:MAG: DUF1552 domain-containing protein [Armatimonadetes bacterium]|nr:DUF1552 domain-containing protein [Armatimonadota bacterium]